MPKFLLPSLGEALAANRPYRLLTLSVAGWFRYLAGCDEQGEAILIEDQRADQLQALARQGGEDPRPLLSVHELFGDLGQNERFVAALADALHMLYEQGAHATVSRYLESCGA